MLLLENYLYVTELYTFKISNQFLAVETQNEYKTEMENLNYP